MKILQIIESAYRATLEEQDDTVLWFTRAILAAGAPVDVLLSGAAVNYAVRGQDASGFAVGAWSQSHPPEPEVEIRKLFQSGARIWVVAEDLMERGIAPETLIAGVEPVGRRGLPALLAEYTTAWKW